MQSGSALLSERGGLVNRWLLHKLKKDFIHSVISEILPGTAATILSKRVPARPSLEKDGHGPKRQPAADRGRAFGTNISSSDKPEQENPGP